jgi:gliding motility-associated-like protein
MNTEGNTPLDAVVECVDNVETSVTIFDTEVCIEIIPDEGFTGIDSLCLIVCNSYGLCDTANLIVVVTNTPPYTNDTTICTPLETPITFCLPIYDLENNAPYIAYVECIDNGEGSVIVDGEEVCITYIPEIGYTGTDGLCLILCDNNGLCDTSGVNICVTPIPVVVPSGFSPDGDGVNDYFEIEGISQYPNANLRVYNRWGNLVYVKEPYNNEWNGERNVKGLNIGNILQEGTYFYLIYLDEGTKPLDGFVVIKKNQ